MQRARSFPRPRSPMRLYLPAAATMRRRASIISAAVASTRQRVGLSPGTASGSGATPLILAIPIPLSATIPCRTTTRWASVHLGDVGAGLMAHPTHLQPPKVHVAPPLQTKHSSVALWTHHGLLVLSATVNSKLPAPVIFVTFCARTSAAALKVAIKVAVGLTGTIATGATYRAWVGMTLRRTFFGIS